MRKRIGLSLMVAAILVGVGMWTHAQVVQPPTTPGNPNPTVLSGADVGFRIDRWEGNIPVGRWVVRSDGKWIEPRTTGGIRRLTSNP